MPDAPDWTVLDAALDRALDLEGPERDAYLASLDEPSRSAVESLLRDALRDDPLLDHPGAVLGPLTEPTPEAEAVAEGVRVGPYQIEGLVGEGGMGRVYRARRADGAFDQTVAVKVVRQSLALAGSDVAARLRRERALLATLDHPGIARLIDGGETDDGVPYLVTEFVDGAPITAWADAHGLGVHERVRLAAEVARAVDHAHRRFVVHRDLKPSNVLVTERDGRARPVVLDFGIAKLLEAADETSGAFPLTQTGMRLLTPAYAAPELYEPTATVTTAADVYGLGALLYEMLTGRRPHDDSSSAGPPTTEPTRPSKRVTEPVDGVAPPDGAASRSRVLRGDLDTICLKALHPDPARRYASAADLADDLGRYRDGRPVEARRDSLAYVASRFVRRNRTVVAAGAMTLVALVGGLGVSLVSLGNEREARAESEVQARRATEAADLLAGILRTSDPDYDGGRAVTVAEAVEEGVERIRRVKSDPLRAYLLRVLGETYIRLGEPAVADSLLWEALAIHGENATSDEATQVRRKLLATQDALANPERVLALARRLQKDAPDDLVTPLRWASRAYSNLGRHGAAIRAARQVHATARTGSAEERVRAASGLGEALAYGGRAEEAVPYLEEAVRLSVATFGREDGRTSNALTSLGQVRGEAGDMAGAEEALRAAIAFHAERYGADRVGYPMAYLGTAKLRAGQYRAAAALLDSAVTMAVPIVGRDHQDVVEWVALEAEALNGAGAYDAAERAAREVLAAADVRGARVRPATARRAQAALDRALRE